MASENELKEFIDHRIRNKNKKIRNYLMKQDPHCHWCGIEVIWFYQDGGTLPNNFATVDHLYGKFTPERRYRIYKYNEDKVLACYGCNFKRGQDAMKAQGKKNILKRQELLAKRKPGEQRAVFFGIYKEIK